MDKANILIIDDEETICEIFSKILQEEGYTVYTAVDGRKGLRIARERTIDIVLLDIKMPRLDGIGILKRIKGSDGDTVVIVITGYGTITLAKEAMKLGAFDFVTKPFDLNYVKSLIKEGLHLRTPDIHKAGGPVFQ
ncbi:MAG: response regulator [Candidatus Omnitrophica bacterium]|nr:response regulator [Candidatus Omnitrophota bacterium]